MHPGIIIAGLGALFFLAILIALVIAGLFMYVAAKLVGIEKASLGRSILVVLLGGILQAIVTIALSFLPGINILLGIIAYVAVIKSLFETGWLKAFLAWIMVFVLELIIVLFLLSLFGVGIVGFMHFLRP
ncbi:hypothetical protein PNA2_1731 [Pyrococcus sp. NA2]|uniref:hypothetical protein n=1 Tax=unclassified Pyrococcus TaxID=2629106 RepID=UPI000209AB1D|nr:MULTISPECIES: hypothetical protein [unclassified Pyrococcus]AEC52646.1 hypothetical protein PNA2_1731 [Pyrococcus sp. NA2]MDK2870521.1 hypothetical protein [Pyrococcus sp.]